MRAHVFQSIITEAVCTCGGPHILDKNKNFASFFIYFRLHLPAKKPSNVGETFNLWQDPWKSNHRQPSHWFNPCDFSLHNWIIVNQARIFVMWFLQSAHFSVLSHWKAAPFRSGLNSAILRRPFLITVCNVNLTTFATSQLIITYSIWDNGLLFC